jgi:hypothetical protein
VRTPPNRTTPPCPGNPQRGDDFHPNSPTLVEPPEEPEPEAPEWTWDGNYMTPDNLDTTIRVDDDDDDEIEVAFMIRSDGGWSEVECRIPAEAMLELLRKSGKL